MSLPAAPPVWLQRQTRRLPMKVHAGKYLALDPAPSPASHVSVIRTEGQPCGKYRAWRKSNKVRLVRTAGRHELHALLGHVKAHRSIRHQHASSGAAPVQVAGNLRGRHRFGRTLKTFRGGDN
jgi:hypothetical protein